MTGGALGAIVANLMFELPAIDTSATTRSSGGLSLAEGVATLGLVLVIFGVVRSGRSSATAFAVGAYIGGAYFFTASTGFANPAVTVGRMLTDTFTGIAPISVAPFVVAQLRRWPRRAGTGQDAVSRHRVGGRRRSGPPPRGGFPVTLSVTPTN